MKEESARSLHPAFSVFGETMAGKREGVPEQNSYTSKRSAEVDVKKAEADKKASFWVTY